MLLSGFGMSKAFLLYWITLYLINGVKASSHITMELAPQVAAVSDDVQIKCAHNISSVINYYPRIAVNSRTYTVDILTRSEKYNLTDSTVLNGVAVLVLTLHNVGIADNRTTFQCYFRLNGGLEIRSNVAALMVQNRDSNSLPSNVETADTEKTQFVITPTIVDKESDSSPLHMYSTVSYASLSTVVKTITLFEPSSTESHNNNLLTTAIVTSVSVVLVLGIVVVIVSSVCLWVKVKKRQKNGNETYSSEEFDSTKLTANPCYMSTETKGSTIRSDKNVEYASVHCSEYTSNPTPNDGAKKPREYEASIELTHKQTSSDPSQSDSVLLSSLSASLHLTQGYETMTAVVKKDRVLFQASSSSPATCSQAIPNTSENTMPRLVGQKPNQDEGNQYVDMDSVRNPKNKARKLPTPWEQSQGKHDTDTPTSHIYDKVVLHKICSNGSGE